MNPDNKVERAFLSIALLVGSYWLLSAPTKTITETNKQDPNKEIAIAFETSPKFREWVGLFFLTLPVWLWRKELELNSFGFFGGPDVSQSTPKDPESIPEATTGAEKVGLFANSKPVTGEEVNESELRRQRIVEQIKKRRSVTPNRIAQELGISITTAKALLFKMVEDGILRCDGFPKSAQFTLISSLENRAIDRVRAALEARHEVISERRYVRIDSKYDIDALFETDAGIFVVEIRRILHLLSFSDQEKLVSSLTETARRFKGQRPHVFLAYIADDLIKEAISGWAKRITPDSEGIPIRIEVYSEKDLLC